MDMVRKLLAVFCLAVALLVAVHFVFNSFYRDLLDTVDVWGILDWADCACHCNCINRPLPA